MLPSMPSRYNMKSNQISSELKLSLRTMGSSRNSTGLNPVGCNSHERCLIGISPHISGERNLPNRFLACFNFSLRELRLITHLHFLPKPFKVIIINFLNSLSNCWATGNISFLELFSKKQENLVQVRGFNHIE